MVEKVLPEYFEPKLIDNFKLLKPIYDFPETFFRDERDDRAPGVHWNSEDIQIAAYCSIPDPREEVEKILLSDAIEEILNTLTEREKLTIKMRFFENMTLEETGEYFNVTRTRIQQLESKALRKMRHPTRAKRLKPFLLEEYETREERLEREEKEKREKELAKQREIERDLKRQAKLLYEERQRKINEKNRIQEEKLYKLRQQECEKFNKENLQNYKDQKLFWKSHNPSYPGEYEVKLSNGLITKLKYDPYYNL